MECYFEDNPGCGFVREHASFECTYKHNPPGRPTHHVCIEGWCGNVCEWCSELLLKKHPEAEVVELPPEKVLRKIRPWEIKPLGLTL